VHPSNRKEPITDPIEINRRNWDERAIIHARDMTGFYRLDRVRSGEDRLRSFEATELGDICQKRVLHLQCHIGTDTLCLVRLGAIVTGLDFSAEAIRVARRLADEAGLKAEFVLGRVDEAARLTPGHFDLVFVTWGTICWLPDLTRWAHVIATVLRPGGELYFADAHPSFLLMEERGGKLVPTYDFQTPVDHPLEFKSATTYTGDQTVMTHQATRQWIHSLSTILEALIEAALTIKMFHEHEILPWRGLEIMVPAPDGCWRLPDEHPRFPLSFSLRARKE
jgi:SAM-dependent methyltransferase